METEADADAVEVEEAEEAEEAGEEVLSGGGGPGGGGACPLSPSFSRFIRERMRCCSDFTWPEALMGTLVLWTCSQCLVKSDCRVLGIGEEDVRSMRVARAVGGRGASVW